MQESKDEFVTFLRQSSRIRWEVDAEKGNILFASVNQESPWIEESVTRLNGILKKQGLSSPLFTWARKNPGDLGRIEFNIGSLIDKQRLVETIGALDTNSGTLEFHRLCQCASLLRSKRDKFTKALLENDRRNSLGI